jgi:hypothetical protein
VPRVNHVRATSEPSSADWGGFATFSGAILTVFQPSAVISLLLPAPLQLTAAAWPGRTSRDHPIVFIVGEMAHGGAHLGGVRFWSGLRYREMAIMIPFVKHPAREGPMVFSCQMFADDVRPVVLGNSFYGLRKHLADIEWEGVSYRAHHRGEVVFQCTGGLPDRWSRCVGNADRGLRWLRGTFALPILGLRPSGQYVSSGFHWDFDQAQACPIETQLSWCPAGEEPHFHWQSVRDYSFAMRDMGWRTGAPRPLRTE